LRPGTRRGLGMPIARELKHLYGHHWRTVIRPRILHRCGGRCERCHQLPRRIEVAHLDGDAFNREDDNLAGLCSRCHKAADYKTWSKKSRGTRSIRKDAARPLFATLDRMGGLDGLAASSSKGQMVGVFAGDN
jgi:hypothetical protein